MPRLIDYSVRFQCIREAVYTLTLREGANAISGPAVAAELGMSLSSVRRLLRSAESLPHLGLQWVEYRRRTRLWQHAPGSFAPNEDWQRAANALLDHLPYDLQKQDDDKVWWRLVAGFHQEPWAQKACRDNQSWVLEAARAFVERLPGLPDPDYEKLRLVALVSGSAHDVRMESLEPGECLDLVRKHLLCVVAACHEGGAHGAA
jgi:hypothetical protein